MTRTSLCDPHRFRILLWTLAICVAVIIGLGYDALVTNVRLSWLENNLRTSVQTSTQFTPVTSENNIVTDLPPITSLTLPLGWRMSRQQLKGEDWQALSLHDAVPDYHFGLTGLLGSSINISILESYNSYNEFAVATKAMYETKNPYSTVTSFKEVTVDGYPGYRAEAEINNGSFLGVPFTKNTKAISVQTYVGGRAIEFLLLTGSFSSSTEISQAIKTFDDLVASVKLAH